MESQNKERKKAIVKAVVWTTLALVTMFFCINSYFEDKCKAQEAEMKKEWKAKLADKQERIEDYSLEIIKLNSKIANLSKKEEGNKILSNEYGIQLFFLAELKSIDSIYNVFVETSDRIINGDRSTRFSSVQEELKANNKHIESELNILRKKITGENPLPDSMDFQVSASIWQKQYLEIVDLRGQLIFNKNQTIKCVTDPPLNCNNPEIKTCRQCQGEETQPAPSSTPCDCKQYKQKLADIKSDLQGEVNKRGNLRKEDIREVLRNNN